MLLRTTHLTAAAAVVVALAASHASAQECGFSLHDYQRPLIAEMSTQGVRDALAKRDYASVAKAARKELGPLRVKRLTAHLRRGETNYDEAFNEGEVRAALAIAMVRSGGKLGLGAVDDAKSAGARKKNLGFALALLLNERAQESGDPVLSTYTGEAYLALGKTEEARAILEDLAGADLIVSPEGWAALAKLRTDTALAEAAQQRCRAMSDDEGVCGAAAATTPAAAALASRS